MNELEEALKMDYTGEAQLFGFNQAFLFTERDIELACGSLLAVRSGTVQLVHLSAKDFLQKSALNTPIDGDLQEFLVDVPIASLQIASQCASYLLSRFEPETFLPKDIRSWSRDVEALRLSLPFLDYACFNWLVHLANSTKSSMTEQEEEVLQSFFQSQTCLIWIELMFNLDQDCLFFLRLNIQTLLDWATMQIDSLNLLADTQSNIIRVVKLWATSLLQLLSEYGAILKLRPSEIYFIDPEMFESLRFSTSGLEMPYERHVILNDPLTPNQQRSLPENQHFQYTGTADQVGCLYFDRFRNVFLIIDGGQQLGAPLIFCQERSTGRRLAPLSDPELENEEENISVAGTIMSADGKHLAVVFTWFSNNSSEPTVHTTVWAVPKVLNFDTGHRTSPWAKKLFSSTVNTEIFERSVRPLVFGVDGSLSCPSGLITFSTGEIQALTSDLLESPVTQLSYSGDGESLVCLSNEDEIVVYTLGGQIVSSFATDGEYPSLLSFSCRGESVIYTSSSSSEKRHIPTLLEISTGKAQQFEIPAGIHYNSKSLLFDDDRQILGIFPYQDTPENTITRLLIWTGLPSEVHLWATKELPTNILGHFLDERSLDLYIIHPGRIWSRINLKSPKLLSVETYTAGDIDTDPVRVEYCVAKNGTKLGIVRLWRLK